MPCQPIQIGNVTAIACSRGHRSRPPRCSVKGCVRESTKLCDFPLGKNETCDKPLCNAHAVPVGGFGDRDFCPDHLPVAVPEHQGALL